MSWFNDETPMNRNIATGQAWQDYSPSGYCKISLSPLLPLTRWLGDGKDAVLVDEFVSKDRLTSWDFKAGAPKAETLDEKESSLSALIPIYRGPPRYV